MNLIVRGTLLVGLALTVSACGASKSKKDDSPEAAPGDQDAQAKALVGSWSTGCLKLDEAIDGMLSMKLDLAIAATTYEAVSKAFSDGGCATIIEKFTEKGSHTAANSTTVAGAVNVDLAIASSTTKVYEGHTSKADCGDETVPVTDEYTCTVADASFDLVKVDGDKLVLGDSTEELDGSTAAKRPIALDESTVLHRIK